MVARMKGGAGFPVSNLLRDYFHDYAYRISTHGPHTFPSSFNVVESFLRFSYDYFMFDLREEREHLLRLHDYLDWYTSGAMPEEPAILADAAKEGVIYSYNMVEPTGDFKVGISGSEIVIAGVAVVRHATELSMLVLCGETPPSLADGEATNFEGGRPGAGKGGLEPSPEYSAEDRYLKEIPGYSRVIGLVRFDLQTRQWIVRYLNHDLGPAYRVATDDPTIFTSDVTASARADILAASAETLARYEPLFATLSSLMYLPVFFIDRHDLVTGTTFSTELRAGRSSTEVKRAIRRLGVAAISFTRRVDCLQVEAKSQEEEMTIVPPELEYASDGFWKQLPPGQAGEDEDGNAILGRTWVERTETWSSASVAEFVVRKQRVVEGVNPGYIYVMRSGSHRLDLYKIGRTTRATDVRASEVTSATGVPTPFEVLAEWEVGDTKSVEEEAHRRLRAYRVNKRREFFRVPLPTIIREIDSITSRL